MSLSVSVPSVRNLGDVYVLHIYVFVVQYAQRQRGNPERRGILL